MLFENHKYHVTVTIAGRTFEDFFYTELNPLYNSVQSIRNSDVGYLLGDISDEKVLLKIHEASKVVDEIAKQDILNTIDEGHVPFPVKKYVLEKAKLDLLLFNIYYKNQQFKSGSLADFDITSIDYSQIKPVIDELKDEVEKWKKKIGGFTSANSALKSKYNQPYPYNRNKSLQRGGRGFAKKSNKVEGEINPSTRRNVGDLYRSLKDVRRGR